MPANFKGGSLYELRSRSRSPGGHTLNPNTEVKDRQGRLYCPGFGNEIKFQKKKVLFEAKMWRLPISRKTVNFSD